MAGSSGGGRNVYRPHCSAGPNPAARGVHEVGEAGVPARFVHRLFTGEAVGLLAMMKRARASRLLAILVAFVALALTALTSLTALTTLPAAAAGGNGAGAAGGEAEGGPVVFIGVPGLAWSDVSAESTPALWQAAQASVGSLVVRTAGARPVACPLDGWLAINTSVRASGPSSRCDLLVAPVDTFVPIWPRVEEGLETQSYSAELGLLARNLKDAGVSALAIGPGAGVALANQVGHVAAYEDRHTPQEGLPAQVSGAVADHD